MGKITARTCSYFKTFQTEIAFPDITSRRPVPNDTVVVPLSAVSISSNTVNKRTIGQVELYNHLAI